MFHFLYLRKLFLTATSLLNKPSAWVILDEISDIIHAILVRYPKARAVPAVMLCYLCQRVLCVVWSVN